MNIRNNIEYINDIIQNTCKKTGRDPQEIKLLAVTKTQPVTVIEKALEAGISCIGENKIQEAETKLSLLKDKYSEFHFIGHLQSNKIKKLISLKPSLIQSLDSLLTIRKLNDHLIKENIIQDILIQVNTSGEESKFGIEPDEVIKFISQTEIFQNIRIKGLMTIGMFTSDRELVRGCFRSLKRLFEELKNCNLGNVEMEYLSMGMTNDYIIAIEEGANILRIGSAIFGPRNY